MSIQQALEKLIDIKLAEVKKDILRELLISITSSFDEQIRSTPPPPPPLPPSSSPGQHRYPTNSNKEEEWSCDPQESTDLRESSIEEREENDDEDEDEEQEGQGKAVYEDDDDGSDDLRFGSPLPGTPLRKRKMNMGMPPRNVHAKYDHPTFSKQK